MFDRVLVRAGDYSYAGWCVSTFGKRSGAIRAIVEDEHGRLFIHRLDQLSKLPDDDSMPVPGAPNGMTLGDVLAHIDRRADRTDLKVEHAIELVQELLLS